MFIDATSLHGDAHEASTLARRQYIGGGGFGNGFNNGSVRGKLSSSSSLLTSSATTAPVGTDGVAGYY